MTGPRGTGTGTASGTGRRARLAARLRRAGQNLRIRVTATATLAAVVLAVAGAVVFAVLFDRSLQASTDDALRTIVGNLTADLAAAPGPPDLAPLPPDARATVLQLVRPDGTVAQTARTSQEFGRLVRDGRTTLATPADLAAAATRPVVDTRGHARVVLASFTRPDGRWTLLAAADLEQVNDAARDAETSFFLVVPVVVVLIAAGAWLLSGAVLRPVERMRADAAALRREAAGGALPGGGRVYEPDSGDRIAALARTMNGLLADLSAAAERQRSMLADAGHELRTPLSVLRTELELADRPDRDPAYLRDAIAHAREEVDRLSALAEDLLLLADADRRAVRNARPTSLADVVDAAVRAHRGVAQRRAVDLRADTADPVTVSGDPASLRRVVDNLLSNALAVARREVVVTVDCVDAGRTGDLPGAPRAGEGVTARTVRVAVTDDGPGFAPDFLPHAFERFTRADQGRHRIGADGAGLGLAIVAAVAAAHGGEAVATNTDRGARVTVLLPAD